MEGKVRCHTIPAGVVENERHVLPLAEVSIRSFPVNNMIGLGLCSQRLYFAHALSFCLPERSEGSRTAGISECGDRHSNSAVLHCGEKCMDAARLVRAVAGSFALLRMTNLDTPEGIHLPRINGHHQHCSLIDSPANSIRAPQCSARSAHREFLDSIKAIFFARVQPLSSFSRPIARCTSS